MQNSSSCCWSGLSLSPLNPTGLSHSFFFLYSSWISQSSPRLPTNVCFLQVLREQGPVFLAPSDCSESSCCANSDKPGWQRAGFRPVEHWQFNCKHLLVGSTEELTWFCLPFLSLCLCLHVCTR